MRWVNLEVNDANALSHFNHLKDRVRDALKGSPNIHQVTTSERFNLGTREISFQCQVVTKGKLTNSTVTVRCHLPSNNRPVSLGVLLQGPTPARRQIATILDMVVT